MNRSTTIIFALVASLGFTSASASPARTTAPCRCAQLTVERYYQDADVVVAGRVTAIYERQSDGTTDLAIELEPQFRQGRTFKGTLDNVTLLTADNSASCGVPVERGATYVIFARLDVDDPTVARFDTCSGTRQYPDAQQRDVVMNFAGTPDSRVLPLLFELADTVAQQSQSPAPDYHTSPACWDGPRIVHTGTPAPELRQRIRLFTTIGATPDSAGVVSPDNAYTAYAEWRAAPDANSESHATVLVDTEQPRLVRLDIAGPRGRPQLSWTSEKLLFVRIAWGRIVFTDLLIDVERARIIYEEGATDGQIAFQQFQQACIGQCPCFVVPGSADSLPAPPRNLPAPDQAGAIDILARQPLAFLDDDWDGRVFTDAAGRGFTVSALKTQPGPGRREEYPIDILEQRRVDGTDWLHVAIYAVSRCIDPDAVPLHAGWIPAFSASGRFVVGTWARGC